VPVLALGTFSLSAWWAYSKAADRVLWTAAAVLCLLHAANGLMLAIVAARIKAQRFTGPVSATVGAELRAPVSWPVWLAWQPFVRIRVDWLRPACSAEIRDGAECLRFARRLKADTVTRRIKLQDWMGIWSWEFETVSVVTVTIFPALVPPSGPPPKLHHANGEGDDSEGSGEGDLLEFRAYQQGDSANRIMWKLFLRSGKIYVRRPEKAGSPRVGILLVCSANDEPAAELAWYLTNKSNPLSQTFFGDNWVFGTSVDFIQNEDQGFVATSAEAAGDRIIASGGTMGVPDSRMLENVLENFVRHAGPGLSTVAVLMGEPLEGIAERGITGCHFFRIRRGAGGALLEWELVQ
jgi:hypothetical protein